MQCPTCGQVNQTGAKFCKSCGTALPMATAASPAPPPPVASPAPSPLEAAPIGGPSYGAAPYAPAQQAVAPSWSAPAVPAPMSSRRVIHKISPLSVLKIAAAIYGLMGAIFGCLFVVLPGILGAGLLSDLADEAGFGGLGGGSILVVLLSYVLGVVLSALIAGLSAAIAALIYNLVARYIGGIEVEVS